jgi:ferrous iron transport protein A
MFAVKADHMTTLRTIKPGETVRVSGITGKGAIKRRIMDMGITQGVVIFVRKVAPLGDPVEVTVRGYELSLRKADADIVEVVSVE